MRVREWVHGLKYHSDYDAIVLLSGGLDSSTVTGLASSNGRKIIALSFSYGQRHSKEIESARKIANHYGCAHAVVGVDLSQIGGSSLIDTSIDVEHRKLEEIGERMPTSYVPARNSVFLSVAFGMAESHGATSVYIGANSLDYSGYPDCRQEYFNSMEVSLNLGTSESKPKEIRIISPLVRLTKSEIIAMGTRLGVPYELTWSCYEGGNNACGKCDSCLLRLKGFMEAGEKDPITYDHLPDFYAKYLKER